MKRGLPIGALLVVVAAMVVGRAALPAGAANPDVRLNQMQVIGSHNSYHVENPALSGAVIDLAYTAAPLDEQFSNQGVRQIELDVFADPDGSLWRPFGVPGYKVLHIETIDEGATCETLVACLGEVKAWSDAHPAHMPIGIQIELKDSDDLPTVPPVPVFIGTPQLDALDAEILSVFDTEHLITPDDVRGSRSTLEEAVLTDGWPRINDVRGKVMFLLDNKRNEYVVGHPSLQGRVAFAPSAPGLPDAAFLKLNDPLDPNAHIAERVAEGYMVRTRADNTPALARDNDTTMRDAALASGAQWVSTDWPAPGMAARFDGSPYVAQIPGGTPARCNPVNAPPGCENTDIENLQQVPPSSTTESTTTTSGSAPTSSTQPTAAAALVATTPRFTG
jgi:hypothetical protein